jgi:hypothetical protein
MSRMQLDVRHVSTLGMNHSSREWRRLSSVAYAASCGGTRISRFGERGNKNDLLFYSKADVCSDGPIHRPCADCVAAFFSECRKEGDGTSYIPWASKVFGRRAVANVLFPFFFLTGPQFFLTGPYLRLREELERLRNK